MRALGDHVEAPSLAATAVEVRAAQRTYPGRPPVTALDGVDLAIAAGSLTAVLGESGSGKTTLLRAIAGFDRLDGGTITLGGRAVSGPDVHVAPARRRVGIVPQDGSLFPHLTVARNVAYGIAAAARRAALQPGGRVSALLEMVGLAGYERRRPHQLSGGQQQRVAVARALAPEPAVVLLDEPFAALDTVLRERLRADVVEVLRASGAAALLVTHDPAEAMAFADRLAVMRAGRIVQTGTTRELYLRPVDRVAAVALGPVVSVPATVRDGVAHGAVGTFAVDHPDGPVEVLVRPEQVVPRPAREGSRHDPATTHAEHVRNGGEHGDVGGDAGAGAPGRPGTMTVRAVEFQGHDVLVELVAGTLTLRARWPAAREPAVGDRVAVALAGAPLLVAPVAPSASSAP